MLKISSNQQGIIIIWFSIILPVILYLAALLLNISYQLLTMNNLQLITDACAHSAAVDLDKGAKSAKKSAIELSNKNYILGKKLNPGNIQVTTGYWDTKKKLFITISTKKNNAVKVVIRYHDNYILPLIKPYDFTQYFTSIAILEYKKSKKVIRTVF